MSSDSARQPSVEDEQEMRGPQLASNLTAALAEAMNGSVGENSQAGKSTLTGTEYDFDVWTDNENDSPDFKSLRDQYLKEIREATVEAEVESLSGADRDRFTALVESLTPQIAPMLLPFYKIAFDLSQHATIWMQRQNIQTEESDDREWARDWVSSQLQKLSERMFLGSPPGSA